jgi:hypothetical protein
MELSPSWEATNCAATQELPSILWNPKVHYRVHKIPTSVSILSQNDPVYTIPFYLSKIYFDIIARGRVVSWGTILQAGRSRVRVPMRWFFFFNLPNPSSRTKALGLTRPLTEMSIRNLPGGKGRPARKADNLTAICEPIV